MDNIITSQQVGEIVAKLRKSKKLTQIGLADKIGESRQTIGHWETGHVKIDVDALLKLANILGVTPNDLCGFVVPKSHKTSKRKIEEITPVDPPMINSDDVARFDTLFAIVVEYNKTKKMGIKLPTAFKEAADILKKNKWTQQEICHKLQIGHGTYDRLRYR